MNFVNIRNGKIVDFNSKYLDEDIIRVEVSEETYNAYVENPEMYIWDGYEVVIDPDYEAKQAQKEKARIAMLSCTKRDFALMLQELGVNYFTQLKPLIESNPQAQLEWELCERLYRFNPMLDLMASQLGVTPEQLDGLFRYANGEITIEQFRELIPQPDVDNPEEVEEEKPVADEVITE